jgi:hypothetical protein
MKPVTKRGGGEGGEQAFVPTREWVQAFRAQWQPELIEAAHRYARTQARKVALLRPIDASYAAELVQDIVGDTVLGVIAWDPGRVPLKKHVLDAIKSRTRHAYVQALKFRAVRIDKYVDEAERALAASRASEGDADVTRTALRTIRDLAHDDREVILLLDAYEQLVTKRFDVLKLTKLTSKQYDAARHRLKRLVDQLPASLRPTGPRE